MKEVRVALAERSYPIHIGSDQVGAFARAQARGSQALLVTDENVARHSSGVEASLREAGFEVGAITLPAGEAQKSLATASKLYDRMAELRADRKALVVALGGGVIGDLAGFVAATYNRGIDLLMVPTTLLAMVDSSVGGKVGINHPSGKNLIGAFHQPVGVWIDTAYLGTLPEREYRSGLAEVVKYGVILDADLFTFLEGNIEPILQRERSAVEYIVARSCELKARVVQEDERELLGKRVVLNYGHTFAHAFETVAGYGTWLHGEAVAAGMVCASRLAHERGLIEPEITGRQEALLRALGLPTHIPSEWPVEEMLEVMRRDKKNVAGRIRLVLPTRLGSVSLFDDASEEEIRQGIIEKASP